MQPADLQPCPDVATWQHTMTPTAAWGGQQQQCALFDGLADAVRQHSRELSSHVLQNVPEKITFAHIADLDRMSKDKKWCAKSEAHQGALLYGVPWLLLDCGARGLPRFFELSNPVRTAVVSKLGRSIGTVFLVVLGYYR